MKSICFYFQVHQPNRLRTYRFFDIGRHHDYYDEAQNRYLINRIADKCYIPANQMMLDLIQHYGKDFTLSFSISGIAIEQFKKWRPDVIESFKRLADTGQVEFLAETYSHSLSALISDKEFSKQVGSHKKLMEDIFGQTPKTFRNTELIYSNRIGEMVHKMGFNTILTEGAKHILGWKSPNFLYSNDIAPKQHILMRNYTLSDDIAFRFSDQSWEEWPLTAQKFKEKIKNQPKEEQVINLFMDYETFGERQWEDTGIFDFMKSFAKEVVEDDDLQFNTPSQIAEQYAPVSSVKVKYPISWADEEKDLTAWLGNELQDEAFGKLYQLENVIEHCNDTHIIDDWKNLQTSNHFYYMCTKLFSDGNVHNYFAPYESPYEAFINYMNVLSDFILRVEKIEQQQGGKVSGKKGQAKVVTKKRKPNMSTKPYTFLDVKKVPKTIIKKALKMVDVADIKKALNNSDHEISDRITSCMTKREIQAMDQLRQRKPTNNQRKVARKNIVDAILNFYE